MNSLRKVAVVCFATAAIGSGAAVLAASAEAAPEPGSCHITHTKDGHSTSATCNLIGTYYTKFHIEAQFCGTSTCNWVSGPTVASLHTSTASSGGYLTKSKIKYEGHF